MPRPPRTARSSAQLAGLATSPGDLFATSGTTLTLSATQTQSNGDYVWDLTSGQLHGITAIKVVNVPAGGSVIVNIPDTGALTLSSLSVTLDGQAASSTTTAPSLANSTIFNFAQASSLSMAGSWAGTIFAPGAATTFSSGHLWGSVVGASLTGSNESTFGPLTLGLCIPSPTTALGQGRPLLLVTGGLLAGAGFLVVRRRKVRQAAAVPPAA